MAIQRSSGWFFGSVVIFMAFAESGCGNRPTDTPVEQKAGALSLPARGATISIDFDKDPFGAPLARGTVLAEQYAEWGVHFENSFLIGDVATDFASYWNRSTGNMLCTYDAGVDPLNPGACFGGQPAPGTPLIVDLDFDACQIGIMGVAPTQTIGRVPPPPLGHVNVQAFDSAGTLGSSGQGTAFPNVDCDRSGCRFTGEIPAIASFPLSSFSPSSGQLPPAGYHFRRLVITEDGIGAFDSLTITRCAGFVARCVSQDSCAAPGQTVAPSVSIDFGTEDPDGNPITFSQSPPGPFPIGTQTVVTMTASNGLTTSSCQGYIVGRDCTPPTLTCPAPITAECLNGCALIAFPPAVASDDIPGPVTVTPSGHDSCYGEGTRDILYRATDSAGNSSTCTAPLAVADTKPPEVTVDETFYGIDAAFSPPDDELHTVTLHDCDVGITDACEGSLPIEGNARITCVSSDEPTSGHMNCGHDPGHHPHDPQPPADIVLVDDTTVQLRASRDNDGDGRVYTISFVAFDASGNTSPPHTCTLHVRRHPNRPAIDSHPHVSVCRP